MKARGQVICGVNTGLGRASRRPTARASGRVSTSTCAAPWRPPCWATLIRSSWCRSPRSSVSPRCNRARSTCWRATRRSRSSAMPASASSIYRRQLLRRPRLHGAEEAEVTLQEPGGATIACRRTTQEECRRLLPRQPLDTSPSSSKRQALIERLLRRPLPGLPTDWAIWPATAPRQGRRVRHPAAGDLEGAARPLAPRRRRVGRDRALGPVRHARGRRERRDPGQCRRAARRPAKTRTSSASRCVRRQRQDARPRREWAYRIVKQVGNYGESFERNVGRSRRSACRAAQRLWTKGGLMYPTPIR